MHNTTNLSIDSNYITSIGID